MPATFSYRPYISSLRAAIRPLIGILSRSKALVISSVVLCLSAATDAQAAGAQAAGASAQLAQTSTEELGRQLRVGDVVFIRVSALPFKKVAIATDSWTNHVGVVIDVSGADPVIGESTFPFSRATPLSRFVQRSEGGRVEVSRLNTPLSPAQQAAVLRSARQRMGIFYDTGFNLDSGRQFCSRYVREVLDEAAGTRLGEVEDFSTLLTRNPRVNLAFWKLWYFGRIPWQRRTVTPASLLQSPRLHSVFDGYSVSQPGRSARTRISTRVVSG